MKKDQGHDKKYGLGLTTSGVVIAFFCQHQYDNKENQGNRSFVEDECCCHRQYAVDV